LQDLPLFTASNSCTTVSNILRIKLLGYVICAKVHKKLLNVICNKLIDWLFMYSQALLLFSNIRTLQLNNFATTYWSYEVGRVKRFKFTTYTNTFKKRSIKSSRWKFRGSPRIWKFVIGCKTPDNPANCGSKVGREILVPWS